MPFLFSPEHVDDARELLEEGAARGGRSLDGFDIAPSVNLVIDEDADRARDAIRHIMALYVGGMGSREKNFYNLLVRRSGFEDAAKEVQDLYLDGKKDEAAAALPGGADRHLRPRRAGRQDQRPPGGVSRGGRGHAHHDAGRLRARGPHGDGPPLR